jgi:hypothetical protein
MSPESGFEHAITLGKAWLATCLDSHKSCATKARHANIFCSDNSHFITDLSGEGLVPSRLLAFSTTAPPRGDKDVVKLVLSTELDERTQYVALSHRWGDLAESAFPRTLKSNFKRHVEYGLRYADLPTTFRDAIDVTRGTGYGYLWIDSLCIVQGSSKDWKKEARRMAIIYDNAVFTIAAMDAEDSTQGLWPTDGGRAGSLESRAWVCQERMIAPRTMMFTKGSVYWECRQATASSVAPSFVEEDGGTVEVCGEEDWIPPTRPKAIFAFFRDWRLPPLQMEDTTGLRTTSTSTDTTCDDSGTGSASPARSPDIDGDQNRQTTLGIGPHDENNEVHNAAEGVSVLAISADASSTGGPDSTTFMEESSNDCGDIEAAVSIESDLPAEGKLPDFTWSDDDPPVKIWNIYPPEGESGVFVDHEKNIIYNCYGSDLSAHAHNMTSQRDFPVLNRSWKVHPDGPTEDKKDPFGAFMVVVTNLSRPAVAYEPFMRVWWNFIALYTPRNLTYDSDAFLAMNGITSIAQRWTHIRNSFGLWYHFQQYELCWYIDPEVVSAVRPTTPAWIVPSWSWASTRGGLVRNLAWSRLDRMGSLMIKPVIGGGTGTAFDMPLPFQAWKHHRYHALELKGNLRAAKMKSVPSMTGQRAFELHVEPTGRFSDHEVLTFYPDCPSELPPDGELDVWTLLIWHYLADEQARDSHHCVDLHLVLVTLENDKWLRHYGPDTMEMEHVEDERTMRRLGLVEMTYHEDQLRDSKDIHEDMWWKFVRLV